MKQVDFFELPRSVQDRFLSGCRGDFDPKPILFLPATHKTGLVWLTLTPLSVVLMLFLYKYGLGDMESALGRHPTPYIAVYVGLAVMFAVGIVQWAAYRARNSALPFVPGFYLFPACLIDARTTKLGVTPMTKLESVTKEANAVTLRIDGQNMRFPVAANFADQALSAVKLAEMQCKDELPEAARVLLDPLVPPVVSGPFAPDKPMVHRRPLWVKIRFVAALAFGVVGVVIYQKRDATSDAMMFKTAKDKNEIAVYQLYLEKGTAHTAKVSRELLPRAELRGAIAEGTVEAIDAFSVRYPDTDIGGEVESARKAAVEAAFLEAKKPGTFEALIAFEKKYPGHHLEKHVAAERRAIYARAFEALKKKMPESAATLYVAKALIDFAQEKGPQETPEGIRGPYLEVKVRNVPSKALAKADTLVERNPYFGGPRSLPTRYLSKEKLQTAEDALADRFVEAFDGAVESSVLRFRVGHDVDGSKKLPTVDAPTLVVSYRIEPSGANYASPKPRGIYIGLVMFFRVDFLLPGDQKPHVLKHVLPVDVPAKLVMANAKDPKDLEQKVYDKMVGEGFDDIFQRYIDTWLRPEALKK